MLTRLITISRIGANIGILLKSFLFVGSPDWIPLFFIDYENDFLKPVVVVILQVYQLFNSGHLAPSSRSDRDPN